jgi:LPXTG-motif cell wall-anchored protein
MTSAEYEDFAEYLENVGVSPGKPGTGPELTLAVDDRARAPQVDTDPENNWSSYAVTVTGSNGTDLAAIGDKLTGAAGDEVTANVGLRNNGPATLDDPSGASVTYLRVDVPPGTTVISASRSCQPIKGEGLGQPGEAGGSSYHCYSSIRSIAGEEETYEFTLRIDEVVANAKGSVEVNVPCPCGGFDDDLKPANDTAAILVNATGGGGGGGEDGDGGTLPITGAQTGLIAGVGGLLLAVGVGGFVLARRRRTRFVA